MSRQPPFTCGSHSRRAAIKYFLRSLPASNVHSAVTNAVQWLIGNLSAAWDNPNSYMCACLDPSGQPNGTRGFQCCQLDCAMTGPCPCPNSLPDSFACCSCDTASLLPQDLMVPFTTIQGTTLSSTLLDQAASYIKTTLWTSNDPWLKWDPGADYGWEGAQAALAQDWAAFDTTRPVQSYQELGVPFGTTIWAMCHGLLQQVHLTLPLVNGKPTTLGDAWDPSTPSSTPNLTRIEEWVTQLTQDAYGQSPLWWHYGARHRPSQSQACRRTVPRPPLNQTVRPEASAYGATTNATLLLHGWSAMTLGGWGVDCWCGWWLNATHCQVPEAVCEALQPWAPGPCTYAATTWDVGPSMDELLAHVPWDPAWPCPNLQVSDHWGMLKDQGGWAASAPNTSGIMDWVVTRGPSGIRAGSWDSGFDPGLDPSQRRARPSPLSCDVANRSLVDHWVDDLFPAAQGVRQSAPISYCLRFSIELARLAAYQQADLTLAVADQTTVVATWRKRCELKLEQVATCQVYGVYDVLGTSAGCPFTVQSSYRVSITPGCLVAWDSRLWDPCLCDAQYCQPGGVQVNMLLLNYGVCGVQHANSTVLGSIPWPVASESVVPRALGMSAFLDKVCEEN